METKICKHCGKELPLDQYPQRGFGRLATCRSCIGELAKIGREKKKNERNVDEEIANARRARIEQFTARELMEELARRGYKGELTYVKVEKIDITNF